MPSAYLPSGTYQKANGNFPPLPLINIYSEKTPTDEAGFALLSRNGLGLLATNASGPINGMFSKKGTLGGDVFSISDTALYRGTSAVTGGTIAGTGVASWAGSDLEVVVTRGTTARSYIAAGIANIVFPDTASVTAVTYIGSLFVYARASSAKFYWSTPLDGRTIDALDFATAEREPDQLLDIAALGDNLWLFGQQSVEAWAHTGDADLPFTRLENVAFDKGIHSTGCVVRADNSLIFVAANGGVYRVGEVPELISDTWLTDKINDATTVRLFTYWIGDHEMVAVRLDGTAGQTFPYDCKTREWHENQTSQSQWIASHGVMVGKIAYFGHQTTGQIMGWDEWDDMGAELERRFPFALQLNEPTSIDSIKIWANTGQTPLLSGQGSDPEIEIHLSADAGNTFDDWDADSLGTQGEYRAVPEWRSLGMFDFPGVLGEGRVTDPVPLRISAIKINDNAGGRSRV